MTQGTGEFHFDVFLSHSSADTAAVQELAQRLRRAGIRPWLDQWQLIPGRPWQEALEEGLARSETVAVFIGPSGIRPWHNEEMRAAIARAVNSRDDYRVIPVLLPGARDEMVSTFLGRRQWVKFREGLDDDTAFALLEAGIRGHPPEGADVLTLPDEPAPYPGLLPFKSSQAAFFFGRDTERSRLLQRLQDASFAAVIGASGSGKSSLVMAGLLPALAPDWHPLVCVPGADPFRSLANQVTTLVPPAGRLALADAVAQRLAVREDGLSTALGALVADRADISTVLVIVDQFEELFTQASGTAAEQRERHRLFVANLAEAVDGSRGRIRVLITLRVDFMKQCLDLPALRRLLEKDPLMLGAMEEGALREAMVKPAEAVGAMFEKGLVSRLQVDMRGQPGALPLLNFALAQMWQRRTGRWLTHAGYDAIGGLSGAIDRRAESVYTRLSEQQQNMVRRLLLRLVSLGDDTVDTLRRVQRSELEGADELIELLARGDVRLVATEADTVQLAHEALITAWDRLRQWLATDRDALHALRELTHAAQEWVQHGRDESYLFRGSRLEAANRRVIRDDLNTLEVEFLDASTRAMQRAQPRWQPAAGFPEDTVQALVAAGESSRAYYVGTRNIGLVRCLDGATWTVHREGLPTGDPAHGIPGKNVHAIARLAVDSLDASRLFAYISLHGIYKSEDGGATWHNANGDLVAGPEVGASGIDVRGSLVLTTLASPAGSGLYVSWNDGAKWQFVGGNGQAPLDQVYFACLDSDTTTVYAGARNGVFAGTPSSATPAASWEWGQVSDVRSVGIIVADPRARGSFYLASYISRGQGEIWHWRRGEPGRRLVIVEPIPIALAPHPAAGSPVVLFVLLQDGKTLAMTDTGEHTVLDRIPGMALELLATRHPGDGHTWLLLGHQDGLYEYCDPL